MARIPGDPDMGRRPNQQPSRAVVPIDAGIEARGEANASGTIAGTLETAAQRFEQIGARIQSRADTIARVRAFGSFVEESQNKLRQIATEQDLSDPSTLDQYSAFLQQKRDEIATSHTGSRDSHAALMSQMDAHRIQQIGQAGGMAAEAQRKIVTEMIGDQVNQFAGQAYQSPGKLVDAMAAFDNALPGFAGALTSTEESFYTKSAHRSISMMALEGAMARGNFDMAEGILELPGVIEALDVKDQVNVRNAIESSKNKLRDAQMAGVFEGERTKSRLRTLLGREPTQSEIRQAAGISSGARKDPIHEARVKAAAQVAGANELYRQTHNGENAPPEWIIQNLGLEPEDQVGKEVAEMHAKAIAFEANYERINGRKPSPEVTSKAVLGVDESPKAQAQDKINVSTATAYVAENQHRYGAGLMSEEEDALFRSNLAVMTQTRMAPNPVTGIPEAIIPSVSPDIAENLLKRGHDVSGLQVAQFGIPKIGPQSASQAAPGTLPIVGAPQPVAIGQIAPSSEQTAQAPAQIAVQAPPQTAADEAQASEKPPPRTEEEALSVAPLINPQFVNLLSLPKEDEGDGLAELDAALDMIGGTTIREMAPLVAGIVPAGTTFLAGTPFTGWAVDAPQMTRARSTVPIALRSLTRVLQNNPRFSEAERQAVEGDINIKPALWDNPGAYQERVDAIGGVLANRLLNAKESAKQSSGLPADERQYHTTVAKAIEKFLPILGPIPYAPKDPARFEEFRATLKPEQEYIDPNGTIRRVRDDEKTSDEEGQ